MKPREGVRASTDYEAFDDPYTGLAAMILVQAAADLNALRGKSSRRIHDGELNKWELLNFFRSRWAAVLAGPLGIEPEDLRHYAERRV